MVGGSLPGLLGHLLLGYGLLSFECFPQVVGSNGATSLVTTVNFDGNSISHDRQRILIYLLLLAAELLIYPT